MLNQRTFSEIFDEIHSENVTENADLHASTKISAGWESLLEPSHLAFLMGRISQIKTAPSGAVKAYPPPPPRPAHIFSEEETQAFHCLQAFAVTLQNNFTVTSLKRAYRQAVLKTHPDQGGTAESFQAVKKSYQILLAFVNK